MADEYTKDVYKMPREKRGEMVKKIEKLFDKSREYGDDKVQLAMQTYEMVSHPRGCSTMQCFTFENNRQTVNRSPTYAKLIEASDLLIFFRVVASPFLIGILPLRRHDILTGILFALLLLYNEINVCFSKPHILQLVKRF